MCSNDDLPMLRDKTTLLARTDVAPTFLLAEMMVFLIGQRIVRPGYPLLLLVVSIVVCAFTTKKPMLPEGK
jgi:hypothetical protein